MTSLRTPAVAGRFYPSRPEELLRDVQNYKSAASNQPGSKPIAAIGCIAPHAGYIYSGLVAGAVYSQIEIPPTCVILCPNHTGKGGPLAIMGDTRWLTPLGIVEADHDLAARLMRRFPPLEEDGLAHRYEHAIEVQLPFLQTALPENSESGHIPRIVPIALGTRDFNVLHGLSEALAEVISAEQMDRKSKILIIASSDMNHYEPDQITRLKDKMAIGCVLSLDARGLWEVVIREQISMCGFGPTVVMLTAAKLLGAASAELLRYATSGEVSGDYDSVVGYAGIVVR